jgi:hypothetical protein
LTRQTVDAIESRWRAKLGERRLQAIAEAIARLVALEDD